MKASPKANSAAVGARLSGAVAGIATRGQKAENAILGRANPHMKGVVWPSLKCHAVHMEIAARVGTWVSVEALFDCASALVVTDTSPGREYR